MICEEWQYNGDSAGDGCWWYEDGYNCDGYWDTEDFSATDCCGCGGGVYYGADELSEQESSDEPYHAPEGATSGEEVGPACNAWNPEPSEDCFEMPSEDASYVEYWDWVTRCYYDVDMDDCEQGLCAMVYSMDDGSMSQSC